MLNFPSILYAILFRCKYVFKKLLILVSSLLDVCTNDVIQGGALNIYFENLSSCLVIVLAHGKMPSKIVLNISYIHIWAIPPQAGKKKLHSVFGMR